MLLGQEDITYLGRFLLPQISHTCLQFCKAITTQLQQSSQMHIKCIQKVKLNHSHIVEVAFLIP